MSEVLVFILKSGYKLLSMSEKKKGSYELKNPLEVLFDMTYSNFGLTELFPYSMLDENDKKDTIILLTENDILTIYKPSEDMSTIYSRFITEFFKPKKGEDKVKKEPKVKKTRSNVINTKEKRPSSNIDISAMAADSNTTFFTGDLKKLQDMLDKEPHKFLSNKGKFKN